MYICMYRCIYIYIRVHIHICVCMYIYMYVHMHVYVYTLTHVPASSLYLWHLELRYFNFVAVWWNLGSVWRGARYWERAE